MNAGLGVGGVGEVGAEVIQGHEFINDKLDVTVGRRRSHARTRAQISLLYRR